MVASAKWIGSRWGHSGDDNNRRMNRILVPWQRGWQQTQNGCHVVTRDINFVSCISTFQCGLIFGFEYWAVPKFEVEVWSLTLLQHRMMVFQMSPQRSRVRVAFVYVYVYIYLLQVRESFMRECVTDGHSHLWSKANKGAGLLASRTIVPPHPR